MNGSPIYDLPSRKGSYYTHGLSWHPLFVTWSNMLGRYGKHKNYLDIKVCERWKDFQNFYDDMVQPWIEHHRRNNGNTSIDRIKADGDYTPENCRWSTRAIQGINRRNSLVLNYLRNNPHIVEELRRN